MAWPPNRDTMLAFLRGWFKPPSLSNHPDLQAAKNWANLYSPSGREENGEVLLSYAKDQYASLVTTLGELDKKADDLARTILTVFGAAVAVTVASTKIIQVAWPWSVFAVAGLLAQAIGFSLAAVARIPAELETPMQPRELMSVSDLEILPSKSQIQSAAAASYHVAITGAKILNEWKTSQLRRANNFFLVGIAVLLAALLFNYSMPRHEHRGIEMKFELKGEVGGPTSSNFA